MTGINTGKVIAGGLVAGLVANAIDFVTNTYIMAGDWQAFAAAHNMDAAAMTSPAVAGTWIAVDFLFGILLVCTYAAIRPRFGAGAQTAIYAGLLVYLAPTLILFGFTMMDGDVRERIHREHRVDTGRERRRRVDVQGG